MIAVRVFVRDATALGEAEAVAVRRAEVAVARFAGQAKVMILDTLSPEAEQAGVGLAPTVMVSDLVLSVGTAPAAGHVVRAIAAAIEGENPGE